ncbi:MAG: hypothetical protein Q9207_008395 [Kuettlingeria erythrocarpa]
MASTSGHTDFRVPTVTQADIEAFHQSHFVSGIDQSTRHDSSIDVYPLLQHEEGEDNLGYYPDGVKRTLTDEQVSMFRHSEIYSLLRKRQLQKENQEFHEDAAAAPQTLVPALTAIDHSLEEVSGDQTSSYDIARADEARSNTVKRQKRHEGGGIDGAIEAASASRRQIRELDGMRYGIDVLDYGEGPSDDRISRPDLPASFGSSMVDPDPMDKAVEDPLEESRSTQTAKQGKLIWWPAIG